MNKRQQKLLKEIDNILSFWKNTNDLSSLKHDTDIDTIFDNIVFLSELRASEKPFLEEEIKPIKEVVKKLLVEIRKIKQW